MERGNVSGALCLVVVMLVLVSFPCARALASWQENGNPICTVADGPYGKQMVSDGAGGAIITWAEHGSGDYDIYAERVDASGNVMWTANGVAICTAADYQMDPQIISDDAGGAIIVWRDRRGVSTDIYAQRVDASGNMMWTVDGVAICAAGFDQVEPAIASDGTGGAIITWTDGRAEPFFHIYAQRVDASGNGMWTADGLAICTAALNQGHPRIISDGSGGSIIAWSDVRIGGGEYYGEIYAQRVDASGSVKWAANGVPICTEVFMRHLHQLTSDGAGGAIITWADGRSGVSNETFAQRVDASGNVMWTANGVAMSTYPTQTNPAIISDGAGGAIITWVADGGAELSSYDIYAQRVDASGNGMWTANGVAICTAYSFQNGQVITSDGVGGAIITWEDYRGGSSPDVYAQRVDASGNVKWAANGAGICTAALHAGDPLIASDGAGGAIITWSDQRGDPWARAVYAQRVYSGACQSASWQDNGNPVCTVVDDQWYQTVASDGKGGAIITWEDHRDGNYDIYAQRTDAFGCALWAPDGVGICTAACDKWSPELTPDGTGGAIMVWQDNGAYDIYAQRVDASGWIMWTADGDSGLSICAAAYVQQKPQIISDGSGGAIMAWMDRRSESNFDIYAQGVSASGSTKWALDGVGVCTAAQDQANQQLTPDGTGGTIMVWQDNRNGDYDFPAQDIYAQRVNASGSVMWTVNGMAICAADSDQVFPAIASDGAGGAIITWADKRSGNWDIYAQRVDASGNAKWAADGVPICTWANEQDFVQLISVEAGGNGLARGAIITWRDFRSGNWDIYAQRVDASGNLKWTTDGVPVCAAGWHQRDPRITSDGLGGAIITWQDTRTSIAPDVYAQRVGADGSMLWAANGVALCTDGSSQYTPRLASVGYGGAIVAWADDRNGSRDIYAKYITLNGSTDVPYTPFSVTGLSQNVPNPFNPLTRITFSVRASGDVKLRIYDVAGRTLRTLVDGWRGPGEYTEVWDGRQDDGTALASGVYFYRLDAGGLTATRKMVLLK